MSASRPFTTGLAAAVADIFAVSLVTAPPPGGVARTEPRVVRADSQLVQLEALIRSVVTVEKSIGTWVPSAGAVTLADIGATTASTPSPSANPVAPQAVATTGIESTIIQTIAGGVADAIQIARTVLLTPFWYLSAPITIPLVHLITQVIHREPFVGFLPSPSELEVAG